jgi:hypothetical protein
MGLGDDFKEFENDATGQGGNDGDNNANRANGSNDKTEDTLVDSGNTYLLYLSAHLSSPPCPQHHSTIHSPSLILNSNSKLTPSAIDQFASKEGLPAGLDPEVNNLVNDEVNKF